MSTSHSIVRLRDELNVEKLKITINCYSKISKDEHHKEKQRWQTKIVDLEEQVRKSEESNSLLMVQKAEMNKRIQEMEKAQKTLMKNNKKCQGKIRTVVAFETKHYEDKIKQLQEDLAMTNFKKQCLDKISNECCRLKQRKMTADKEEELSRLRNLNVQYCKTIAAYKQLVSDKERKVEVLLRVINRTRKNHPSFNWHELDYQSTSDSAFSTSSQSFEAFGDDQNQVKSNSMTRRWNEESGNEQTARTLSSNASQSSVESGWEEERQKLWTLVKEMRDRISVLQPSREKQQIQIEDLLEANELLEFRLLELENCPTAVPFCAKCSAPTKDVAANAPDDLFIPSELSFQKLSTEELLERLKALQVKSFINDDDRAVFTESSEQLQKLKEESEASKLKIEKTERKIVEMEAQLECYEITMDGKSKECELLKKTIEELKEREKELKTEQKITEDFTKLMTEKLKDVVTKYNDGVNLVSELSRELNEKERNERMLVEKLKWMEIARTVSKVEKATGTMDNGSGGKDKVKQKIVEILKEVGLENHRLRDELNELKLFNKQLEEQIELRNGTIVGLKGHLNSK